MVFLSVLVVPGSVRRERLVRRQVSNLPQRKASGGEHASAVKRSTARMRRRRGCSSCVARRRLLIASGLRFAAVLAALGRRLGLPVRFAAWLRPSAWPAWQCTADCGRLSPRCASLRCLALADRRRRLAAGLGLASASASLAGLASPLSASRLLAPRHATFLPRALAASGCRYRRRRRRSAPRRSWSGRYRPRPAPTAPARPPACPRLQRRRLQAGEQRSAAVSLPELADRVVVLVARRRVALAAAHLVAQVRRRGVDRRQAVDRAERRLQPASARCR